MGKNLIIIGTAPSVQSVAKSNDMSNKILVNPISSGVKYFGKRNRILIAPTAKPK
jgi:hypothetical protein